LENSTMSRLIYPGNYVSANDSLEPVGVLWPPYEYYRVAGYVDIGPANVLTSFGITIPSSNNTDSDKTFPSGYSVPTGAFLLRKAIRVPATNTAGKAATLVGTNTDKLFLGAAIGETGAHVVTAGSGKYAAGAYALDAFAPAALGGAASFLLRVANSAGNAAGTAPTSSLGTIRIVCELIFAKSAPVITLDDIPNGNK
jgi:hypothetical protein